MANYNNPASMVYPGREGTGKAGIFGSEGDPVGALFRRRAEEESIRRYEEAKERDAIRYREGKIDEYSKWKPGEAWDVLAMPVAQGTREYQNAFQKMLADNPSMSANQVYQSQDMADVRGGLEVASKKTRAIQEVYEEIGESDMPNMQKEKLLGDMRHEMAKMDSLEKINSFDIDKFTDLVNDPKYFDADAAIDSALKNWDDQVQNESVGTQHLPGIGHAIIKKGEQAMFGVRGPDGKMVPGVGEEHVQMFLSNDKWREWAESMAAEELGMTVEEIAESEDPEVIETVKQQIGRKLNAKQRQATKYTATGSVAKYPTAKAHTASKFEGAQVIVSESAYTKGYNEIGDDNIAGEVIPSVRVPNMAPNIVLQGLDGQKITVDGWGPSQDSGELVIRGYDKDGVKVEAPFTKENIITIRNAQTKPEDKAGFDKILSDWNQAKGHSTEIDRGAVTNVANQLKSVIDSISNGSSEKEATENLKQILDNAGVEVRSVKAHSPWVGSDKININGQLIDLGTAGGFKKLQALIFDNSGGKYTKRAEVQQPEQPQEAKHPEARYGRPGSKYKLDGKEFTVEGDWRPQPGWKWEDIENDPAPEGDFDEKIMHWHHHFYMPDGDNFKEYGLMELIDMGYSQDELKEFVEKGKIKYQIHG